MFSRFFKNGTSIQASKGQKALSWRASHATDSLIPSLQVATSAFLLQPDAGEPATSEAPMSKQGWGQTRIYEVRHEFYTEDSISRKLLDALSYDIDFSSSLRRKLPMHGTH